MIPATRWRRAAGGLVVAADLLLVLVGAAALPGFTPYAVPLLAGFTAWGLLRPGGWGALALVSVQAVVIGVFRGVPASVTDWALAALSAALVLVTHVCLALLAAWAPGAALPRETLARWSRQTGVLAALGGLAAGVGIVASETPTGAWSWLAAAALLLAAGTTWLLHRPVRRG